MSGLAQALRLRAAPGRLWAARPGGGGAGARPWGWGLALGLALGVKAPTAAGCEAEGGREAKGSPLPPPRDFGAAIERSRDLLRRVKVRRGREGSGPESRARGFATAARCRSGPRGTGGHRSGFGAGAARRRRDGPGCRARRVCGAASGRSAFARRWLLTAKSLCRVSCLFLSG